ncbi:hypothetical protein SAMN05421666_0435 [Roseovarius nanhaiticus]|uniref:Uncharacterized protein n=1 Tax=Roseovarius nanhaiticus TaxID=573024 RepID=A0A1N7EQ41_9RHOB|nr:hypothetical protein [Roseovarius nanhaiticus]SEK69266.1 hypothetical protein SAMN05216208_1700 [Roseovarius nanhaiticus]SIR90211.1 hypothetical protein SAMN05421666_0435 [Roseovarius nanhaiticus]
MAKAKNSAAPKHTEAGPDIAPHGREKTLEEHRGRLEGEPAAAPLETDAESGGASAVAGLPDGEAPRDPAKPYLQDEEREGQKKTAGQERKIAEADASGNTGWLKWVIGGLLLLAIAYAAMQM